MATSFSKLKQGLGLLDILQIGKYKGCRVDSIIESDDGYLRYMQAEKILVFDKSVLDAIANKFSTDSIAVNTEDDASYTNNPWNLSDADWDDDIPF